MVLRLRAAVNNDARRILLTETLTVETIKQDGEERRGEEGKEGERRGSQRTVLQLAVALVGDLELQGGREGVGIVQHVDCRDVHSRHVAVRASAAQTAPADSSPKVFPEKRASPDADVDWEDDGRKDRLL